MSHKADLQNANDIIKQQQELLETQDRKIKEQRDEIESLRSIAVTENLRARREYSKLSDESKQLKQDRDRLLHQNEVLRLRIKQLDDEQQEVLVNQIERLENENAKLQSRVSKENSQLKAENRRLASDRKEAIALIEKMADCCLPVIRDVLDNEDYSDFCKKWIAVVAQWNALMKKEG